MAGRRGTPAPRDADPWACRRSALPDADQDAAAAAIYGAQAANGVVLINTKKGKKGKSVT